MEFRKESQRVPKQAPKRFVFAKSFNQNSYVNFDIYSYRVQ